MDQDDDPGRWLGDTPMLNLRDDKLRLRVHTVTQFSRSDPERLRSLCHYVASIPFDVPPLSSPKGSRLTLAKRHPVGWYSKAALFQAMLRVAGFPARIRMIRVDARMYRGLARDHGAFALPVVETWTGGRWVRTDNYVYDLPYLAAAREAVQRRGWRSGYGVHLDGDADWDGTRDALVMIAPAADEPSPWLEVYDDPQGPDARLQRQSLVKLWLNRARNRLMTIRIHREVRRLRRDAGG